MLEITIVVELADKDIKTAIIYIFHLHENVDETRTW